MKGPPTIHHPLAIVVGSGVVLGEKVTLRNGVVLGNRGMGEHGPSVGDGVEFGANSVAVGPIVIGDGASIGALALVVKDVRAGAALRAAPAWVRE